MEEKFKSWMIRTEGKLESTAINYSRAIHSLSEHYSSFTGTPTDIYRVDLKELKVIRNSYLSNGKFSEEGHFRHGLNRAAIKAFYRFRLAYPVSSPITNGKPAPKHSNKKKKVETKSLAQRLLKFFTNLFKRKHSQKVPSGNFVGTKKQISKRLLPLLPSWEEEVRNDYKVTNPRCERCNSMEFPEVVEKHPTNSKVLLKTVLKEYSDTKQSVSIPELEVKYKVQLNGTNLLVLCRTCKQKEENRKIERYRHEVPPIMRKGPPELRY